MAAGCDVNPGFRGPPDNSDRLLLNDTPSVTRSTVNWVDLGIPLSVFFPRQWHPHGAVWLKLGCPENPMVYHHFDLYRIWHSKMSPSFTHIFSDYFLSIFSFKKRAHSPRNLRHFGMPGASRQPWNVAEGPRGGILRNRNPENHP